jgi:hypothetical protein
MKIQVAKTQEWHLLESTLHASQSTLIVPVNIEARQTMPAHP